jgi:polar amino acid transport system substrate-binding protein
MEKSEAIKSLAPTGTLRAAINYGNAVLAKRHENGELTGVSVDIAREIARRLGVSLALVPYDGAGKVVNTAGQGAWDLGFLAIDPLRAKEIAYSAPYVGIEGAFAVNEKAAFMKPEELNAKGLRIGVGGGSAYDLHLSRTYLNAEYVRYPTSAAVFTAFFKDKLDAAAGIRQPVEAFAKNTPHVRLIKEAFMQINQAICIPINQAKALDWLQVQLADLKNAGFIRDALKRAGQDSDLAI